MAFVLLATPLDGVSERLAALRMQESDAESWPSHLLPALSAAALLALAYALTDTRSWGCVALAATTIAFILALRTEADGQEIPGEHWLAERKGMAWLLLPFAAAGLWGSGLTALAAYAGGSFFWAQRQVHRPAPAPSAD
jgi:hypothetical protein